MGFVSPSGKEYSKMYTTYIYQMDKKTNLIHVSEGADMIGECQALAKRSFEKFLNDKIKAEDMKFFISKKPMIGTYHKMDSILINDHGEPEMAFHYV
jgi:hypothetical protein